MDSPPLPSTAADTEALKVLVVDDTATNRQILQVFLKKLGYLVETAVDGAQAVECFAASAPDLVLMDVMMPVMDGYEATRRIKQLCGDRWVPVVFLSALDKEENLVTGLDAGGDDYLHKPVSFVVLDAKLRSLKRSIRMQRALSENAARLQRYHDMQEEENALAVSIMERQMSRQGLSDPRVRHWIAPAAHFSGDVIAAARSPEGRLYVLLADATGHGLAAAISVLPVLTMFYSQVEAGHPLVRVVMELNRQLRATMPSGRFVAASLVFIDEEAGSAEVWQGGMPDVLLIGADGKVRERFAARHLPLGIADFDDEMAHLTNVAFDPGEQFVLFSDGLIEATDPAGEQFGMTRLTRVLEDAMAERRLEAVRTSFYHHTGIGQFSDDISLLLVG